MSRLIDKLTKTDQATFQPMGFRASRQTSAEPRMQLIAVAQLKDNVTPDNIEGVDALLFLPTKTLTSGKVLKSILEPLADIPWGIYLQDTNESKASALTTEGCDFLVFPAAATVMVFLAVLPMILDLKDSKEQVPLPVLVIITLLFIPAFIYLNYVWLPQSFMLLPLFAVILFIVLLLITKRE